MSSFCLFKSIWESCCICRRALAVQLYLKIDRIQQADEQVKVRLSIPLALVPALTHLLVRCAHNCNMIVVSAMAAMETHPIQLFEQSLLSWQGCTCSIRALLSRSARSTGFRKLAWGSIKCQCMLLLQAMSATDDDSTLTQLASAWVNLYLGSAKVEEAFFIFQELGDKYSWTVSLHIITIS